MARPSKLFFYRVLKTFKSGQSLLSLLIKIIRPEKGEAYFMQSEHLSVMGNPSIARHSFRRQDQETFALTSDQNLINSSSQGWNHVLVNLNIRPYINCSNCRHRDALSTADSQGALFTAGSHGALFATGSRRALSAAGSRGALFAAAKFGASGCCSRVRSKRLRARLRRYVL